MKYFSTFTGIGGFELGIKQAYEELCNLRPNELENNERPEELYGIKDKLKQWECMGYSEVDKYAIQIYEKHFKHKNYGDITKIIASELPDFDFLCGGFPCQSFSVAGKRKGFEDTRGTLFFDIARIIKEKRPKYFLLENVKGLLSHDNGRTFKTIISTIDELGYDCQWQVLNSKNFGVPQNRERVFIVGHIRGTSRPKVFPITKVNPKTIGKTLMDINQARRVYGTEGTSITLKGLGGGQGAKTGLYEVANTIDANYYKGINRNPGHASSQRGIKQYGGIRRLTPIECERLQGFPDNWTEDLSDTQRYKTLGNAVTVNVIKEIILRLYAR